MIIYHGSQSIIEKPQYGIGNPRNDYGLGFYCTENLELAKEWACIDNKTNGYANFYTINLDNFKILDLRKKDYSILNWIAILLKHRTFDTNNEISIQAKKYLLDNFYINTDDYDIIIGYRADDSYFSFAKDFINNTISVQKLSKAMKLGKLGTQIVIKSKNAFSALIFTGYEKADCREYYIKRKTRDEIARKTYFSNRMQSFNKEDLYVLDIIRKEIKQIDEIL